MAEVLDTKAEVEYASFFLSFQSKTKRAARMTDPRNNKKRFKGNFKDLHRLENKVENQRVN